MSKESLHQALVRLHAELQDAPQLDEEARRLLAAVAADIGRATSDATHAPRLEALAVRFEADHPALAARLRGIADALGRGGL
ncbi:MAG TPA: DUF4404 family protein [Steroidobacteraceae bacterium]|nr:DUF4404 family protein [Steroidobacteraceae bacterium]